MPSLKLPSFRRDTDRPTLKQRAAALKATAARVIRREKPETAAEAVLQIEAQRLLSVAQSEFTRRYAAQFPGLDEPGREMLAARLRRSLRIEALTMAADPNGDAHAGGTHADLTMMTGGVVDDDGRVMFCDAAGRAPEGHASQVVWLRGSDRDLELDRHPEGRL